MDSEVYGVLSESSWLWGEGLLKGLTDGLDTLNGVLASNHPILHEEYSASYNNNDNIDIPSEVVWFIGTYLEVGSKIYNLHEIQISYKAKPTLSEFSGNGDVPCFIRYFAILTY